MNTQDNNPDRQGQALAQGQSDYTPEELQAIASKAFGELATEVCGIIGIEAMLKLIEKHGGALLRVPMGANANCLMAQVIGAENTAKLSRYMGGEAFDVPPLSAVHKVVNRARIITMHHANIPNGVIATNTGKTARWVRIVIADHKRGQL